MAKNLKSIIILFSLLFLYTTIYAEVKVPKEIKFSGETYKQAYQAGNGATSDKVTEYLRSGETLERFEKMLSIWEYPNARDKDIFAGNLIKNPYSPYKIIPGRILENDESTETMMSLIITAESASEYNIYRILMRDGHVVTYQFSYRTYEKQGTAAYNKWIESIEKNEPDWFSAVSKMKDIK